MALRLIDDRGKVPGLEVPGARRLPPSDAARAPSSPTAGRAMSDRRRSRHALARAPRRATRCRARSTLDADDPRARARDDLAARAGCSPASASRRARPGDFFRFDLGDDSMIIVRDEDGVAARAAQHLPPPRHAGLRRAPPGSARRWVCPYHQWSYALDGTLLGCGGMEDELDRAELRPAPRAGGRGRRARLRLAGPTTPSRSGPRAPSSRGALAPQGLDRARVAHRIEYEVARQLEARLGEQPRVLALPRRPPRVRPGELRRGARTPSATARCALGRAAEHARVLALAAATGRPPTSTPSPGLYRFPTAGPLVVGQPHAARAGVRHRVARRRAGGAADGRLPRLRRRHAARAHGAELLVSRQRRPRRPDAAAAGRARADTRSRVQWLVDGDARRGPRLRARAPAARSGSSPASRTGSCASATTPACAAPRSPRARTRRRASTTSRRSSTGISPASDHSTGDPVACGGVETSSASLTAG